MSLLFRAQNTDQLVFGHLKDQIGKWRQKLFTPFQVIEANRLVVDSLQLEAAQASNNVVSPREEVIDGIVLFGDDQWLESFELCQEVKLFEALDVAASEYQALKPNKPKFN